MPHCDRLNREEERLERLAARTCAGGAQYARPAPGSLDPAAGLCTLVADTYIIHRLS